MKSNAHNPLYFSAYPLKAITQEPSAKPDQQQSPYLRAILAGKSRTMSRVRVFPMANPYPAPTRSSFLPKENKAVNNEELANRDWYNNYE